GGSIARVIGGGTGGRDVLRYMPPAAFVGADSFHYTILDQHALQASATVTIQVNGYRIPENPVGTLAGVKASYYNLGPPTALPDFARLVAYASEIVATVNYPATNGNFAGSGRADNVGGVFTGRFIVSTAGSYTFYTESDDGSALY